jgi:undecaprenyl diphosphate synthase
MKIPKHIAIIMDGNGRWAKKRGLPRIKGHEEGVEAADRVVNECLKIGVKYLTLFAFSTENWNRPAEEVEFIFRLVEEFFKKKIDSMVSKGVRIKIIGRKDNLPEWLLKTFENTEKKTSNGKNLTVNVALNYGGRYDILQAAKKMAFLYKENKIDLDNFSESDFSKLLLTEDQPDPDLLIRTSGEYRISNYLMWQLAYSELYFTKTLWPDFDGEELKLALEDFSKRDRRFGAIKSDE